jgi:Inner membrane component of T3SS, cytoplasmic domain/Domain of unknown function (DUF1707)
MRASSGRPAYPSPEVRVSDADRDRVIDELRERFADGSLGHESFVLRVDGALRARWHGELAELLSDLPGPRVSPVRAVLGRLARARREALRRVGGYLQAPPTPALVLPPGPGTFTIGRDAACDLVLSDMTVSRTHAGLRQEAGGWLLSDAGSTNGTRLNGWRVTSPVPVRAGDQVTFGAMTLVITERAVRPQPAGVAVTP